ncbi:hypothetical protein ABFS83_09G042800 [Erythranthe nasuta]
MRRWEHHTSSISLAFLLIMIVSAHCNGSSESIPMAPERDALLEVNNGSLPKIEEIPKTFVWYASYGSNMEMKRFLCYIEGGLVAGMQEVCEGSRDKTRPTAVKWRTVPYRMFFGRNATKTWGPGGVAFLDLYRSRMHRAHIRLYKISLQQFNDVLRQENTRTHVMTSPLFGLTDLNYIVRNNHGYKFVKALKKGWYRTVLYLGKEQNLPVLTFTCSPLKMEAFRSNKLPICGPSKAYKDIIMKALVEERNLTQNQALNYIRDCYKKPLRGSIFSHYCPCCFW